MVQSLPKNKEVLDALHSYNQDQTTFNTFPHNEYVIYYFSPLVHHIQPLEVIALTSSPLSPAQIQKANTIVSIITDRLIDVLKNECKAHGILFEKIYPRDATEDTKAEINELKIALADKEYITDSLFEFSKSLTFSENLSTQVTSSLKHMCIVSACEGAACYMHSEEESVTLTCIGAYKYNSEVEKSNHLHSLLTWVSENNETVILPYTHTQDTNTKKTEKEYTAILIPLKINNKSIGVVFLKHAKTQHISQMHMSFIQSACSLLSVAINQHRVVTHSKALAAISEKNAKLHSALYRFTHEITTQQTLDEVFSSAFQIMHEELKIERFWLGLLNEPGTRIIGQSAFGSGWKKKLVEINIDISGLTHPLAEVIRTREVTVVEEVDEILKKLGLRKFIERHNITKMVLVPLVSSGQILGVLAYESDGEIDLQKSILKFAAELAQVIFSKRLEERISGSETMRAAGLLAAGIAHNFNNLLQGIMGQASLLELYADSPEQIKKSSKIIADSTAKGASLVKQLMSFAYLEEPSFEICNINDVIELNKINFQRALKSEQFIRYHLHQHISNAYADPRQIIRIIQTLLQNASEAMPADGYVEIITDIIEINESSPHFDVPYGSYITLSVRDNGIGMDAETKKRCFEPFFSTKNIDKSSGLGLQGSGMGLAAAYALAKKNGGRLLVDSRKGHGSLFTLYIPKAMHDSLENNDNTRENKMLTLQQQIELDTNDSTELGLRMRDTDKKNVEEKNVKN